MLTVIVAFFFLFFFKFGARCYCGRIVFWGGAAVDLVPPATLIRWRIKRFSCCCSLIIRGYHFTCRTPAATLNIATHAYVILACWLFFFFLNCSWWCGTCLYSLSLRCAHILCCLWLIRVPMCVGTAVCFSTEVCGQLQYFHWLTMQSSSAQSWRLHMHTASVQVKGDTTAS